MKAIAILQKCIPPPYIDIIHGSSILMECLQILEKFCAREALKSKISYTETGYTNNSNKKNSRMQRQEDSNQNLKSDQDSEEEYDEKKISATHQQEET